MKFDPRFPPVGFFQERQLFEHPQTMPAAAQIDNPPIDDRIVAPRSVMQSEYFSPSSPMPDRQGDFPIRDPAHYASLIELTTPVPNGSSFLFLNQPNGKRNFLALRNTSALASVYISFGKDASVNSIFELVPTATMVLDSGCPQNDVYAFSNAANAFLTYAYSEISN